MRTRAVVNPKRTEGREDGTALTAVADELGVSRERALQIERAAISKLRRALLESEGRCKVQVCAACLRASCRQGSYPCEGHRMAGVAIRTVAELDWLARESPHHYR